MTRRVLPRAEYDRLAAIDSSVNWAALPSRAQVLVVERDDQILGHWLYLPTAHAEVPWKATDAGSGVTRQLLAGMRELIYEDGAASVWVSAVDDDTRALLHHLGAVPVPGDHYLVRL